MDMKNTENASENKMGTMPVNKLVWNMSFPMMVSMLVQALYNIVDSIFVARVSENALTAVSLAFPLQTLTIAVGAGTGVGINALLSKSLVKRRISLYYELPAFFSSRLYYCKTILCKPAERKLAGNI